MTDGGASVLLFVSQDAAAPDDATIKGDKSKGSKKKSKKKLKKRKSKKVR